MTKINIGSGYYHIPDYISIDSDPNCKPNYVLDLERENLPFDNNSVEEVIAHHILEHLGDGFFHCMRELYRVCKNGAIIDIAVPHPRHDLFLIDPTHKRSIFPETISMFSKKMNIRDIELRGRVTAIAIQNNVDFEVIEQEYKLDPYYKEIFDKASQEECEHIIRSQNNVIAEIFIKVMVIK